MQTAPALETPVVAEPAADAAPAIEAAEDTTRTRAEINRENAQKSTGPRTAEGKAKVSLNALKSGLYSQAAILPTEDKADFLKGNEALVERFQPQSSRESSLVQTIAVNTWRLERASALEINLITLTTEQQLAAIDQQFGELDQPTRRALAQAAGFQANAKMFDQIARRQSRFERVIKEASEQLHHLQDQRRELENLRRAHEMRQREMTQGNLEKQSQPAPSRSPQPAAQMPHFTGPMKDIKRKQWLRQQAKLNANPTAA